MSAPCCSFPEDLDFHLLVSCFHRRTERGRPRPLSYDARMASLLAPQQEPPPARLLPRSERATVLPPQLVEGSRVWRSLLATFRAHSTASSTALIAGGRDASHAAGKPSELKKRAPILPSQCIDQYPRYFGRAKARTTNHEAGEMGLAWAGEAFHEGASPE